MLSNQNNETNNEFCRDSNSTIEYPLVRELADTCFCSVKFKIFPGFVLRNCKRREGDGMKSP